MFLSYTKIRFILYRHAIQYGTTFPIQPMHNASVMQHNLISKGTENYAFALAPLSLSLVYQPAKDAHYYLSPTAFHTQSPPN